MRIINQNRYHELLEQDSTLNKSINIKNIIIQQLKHNQEHNTTAQEHNTIAQTLKTNKSTWQNMTKQTKPRSNYRIINQIKIKQKNKTI